MKTNLKALRFFLIIIIIGYILKTWVVAVYGVPTASMEPTIRPGSFIVALKLPYVFRIPDYIPFTFIPIQNPQVYEFIRFKKDQIIVFDSPINPTSHPSSRMTFVKRLKALPGDTLLFVDDRYLSKELAVFGSGGVEMIIPFSGMTIELDSTSFRLWKTTIERDMGIELGDEAFLEDYKFKNDFFYFNGDNPISSDSRHWGLVPGKHLRGKVFLILF
ncbi:MAG: signal peptidase I [Balneolales bacterium]|nr:signal peptidase I [Balneolales bacterium]